MFFKILNKFQNEITVNGNHVKKIIRIRKSKKYKLQKNL